MKFMRLLSMTQKTRLDAAKLWFRICHMRGAMSMMRVIRDKSGTTIVAGVIGYAGSSMTAETMASRDG